MYQPVNIEQMRDKLVPLDTFKQILSGTEGLRQREFKTNTQQVRFHYPEGWQDDLDPKTDGTLMTEVTAEFDEDGSEYYLTLDAALEAAARKGLQKSYTISTPGPMIADHVNYWYRNGDDKERLKLLINHADNGLAFTRATIKPFSNVELLDHIQTAVEKRYATDDILVDYKYHHDLNKTSARLIVPSAARVIHSARSGGTDDQWCLGVELSNSLTGQSPLELRGYLFSWWCTNGCTTQHASSGKYRRKPTVEASEAYVWAKDVAADVFVHLEHELDRVQSLTEIALPGNFSTMTRQVFKQYEIPANTQTRILNNLAESNDLTAYGLVNSVTAAANDPDASANEVQALLLAGGNIAHTFAHPCVACQGTGVAND